MDKQDIHVGKFTNGIFMILANEIREAIAQDMPEINAVDAVVKRYNTIIDNMIRYNIEFDELESNFDVILDATKKLLAYLSSADEIRLAELDSIVTEVNVEFKGMDFSSMEKEELISLGFSEYATHNPLMLMPRWIVPSFNEGVIVTSITNRKLPVNTEEVMYGETRNNLLAWGIYRDGQARDIGEGDIVFYNRDFGDEDFIEWSNTDNYDKPITIERVEDSDGEDGYIGKKLYIKDYKKGPVDSHYFYVELKKDFDKASKKLQQGLQGGLSVTEE